MSVKLSGYKGKAAITAGPTLAGEVVLYRITSTGSSADYLWLSLSEARALAAELLAAANPLVVRRMTLDRSP